MRHAAALSEGCKWTLLRESWRPSPQLWDLHGALETYGVQCTVQFQLENKYVLCCPKYHVKALPVKESLFPDSREPLSAKHLGSDYVRNSSSKNSTKLSQSFVYVRFKLALESNV